MKVTWLDRAQSARFFRRFALGRLTMRKPGIGRPLGGMSTYYRVSINQKELNCRSRAGDSRSPPPAGARTSQFGQKPMAAAS